MAYDSDQGDHYAALLRRGGYSAGGPAPVVFGYQSPEHEPELQRLRAVYGLDAAAGMGGEVERLVRLMAWVHDTLKYDGGPGCYNPELRNAAHMLSSPLVRVQGGAFEGSGGAVTPRRRGATGGGWPTGAPGDMVPVHGRSCTRRGAGRPEPRPG